MSDGLDYDSVEVNHVEQFGTKRLVLPDGYEYRSEVDIERIQFALEAYADSLSVAG